VQLGSLDDLEIDLAAGGVQPSLELRPLVAAVGLERDAFRLNRIFFPTRRLI
jgi:hypothetical protein